MENIQIAIDTLTNNGCSITFLCAGKTLKGDQCKAKCKINSKFCSSHQDYIGEKTEPFWVITNAFHESEAIEYKIPTNVCQFIGCKTFADNDSIIHFGQYRCKTHAFADVSSFSEQQVTAITCSANTIKGNRCSRPPVSEGLCTQHFNIVSKNSVPKEQIIREHIKGICHGTKLDGNPCHYKATSGDFCRIHIKQQPKEQPQTIQIIDIEQPIIES